MPSDSWSYSRLTDFERCKRYFELKHIKRIPEPERALPPGKTEHANDRGTRIHQSCEDYVTGASPLLAPEADKHFGPQIDLLRTIFKDGLVSVEGEWGMDAGWEPCSWDGDWVEIQDPADLDLPIIKARKLPDRAVLGSLYKVGKTHYRWVPPWLRLKLDAMVMHDDVTATVIDFKTGRKYGNEIKHAEQLQLYQLSTFMRYPQLQTVFAELWYLDQDEITSVKYSRTAGLRFRDKFTKRADVLLTCDDYPPNPNRFTCRWCMYGPWGSNDCPEGVR